MRGIDAVRDTPLSEAFGAVEMFVDTTDQQRLLMTLWAAHTHIYRKFVATPRLSFVAEGPGSGKSIAMNVALSMSMNPLSTGYISQPTMHNWLEEHPDTTLGFDEIDKVFGIDGRKTTRPVFASIINDGYTSTGKVMITRAHRGVEISVFSPVATAGLGHLPADTRTRAIEIALTAGHPDLMYVPELHAGTMESIGADLRSWLRTRDVRRTLEGAPILADGLHGSDRFRLIMAPLAAIADAADIGDVFRVAVAEWQSGDTEDNTVTTPRYELLAADVRELLGDELMTAGELIDALPQWNFTRDAVGARMVGNLLRQAGIQPTRSNGRYGYRAS